MCERYGIDPSSPIEDDFAAFQFRLALAVSSESDSEHKGNDTRSKVAEGEARIKRAREELGVGP